MPDIKRKWQIALRRYVVEGRPAVEYAPYFGIDNKNFRGWIELCFKPEMNWENFGKRWQLDHIVPVSFFDSESDKDLCLCWNFINIYPSYREIKEGFVLDLAKVEVYFENIYHNTGYYIALEMVKKIKEERGELLEISNRINFLNNNKEFLNQLEGLSSIEMEFINKGMGIKQAIKEAEDIRRLSSY